MEKNKLLLIPLFSGAILMFSAWYLSYPLFVDSVDDFVFNHVSLLYWLSLPLLLTSMYLIAATCKSIYVKWIMTVGIITTMYSLSYFYARLPGSDSQFVRGMTENLIVTKNLDSSQPHMEYFQWPSLFILANVAVAITGLKLASIEFLMYIAIGFLLATSLYIYAFKTYKKGGFVAVIVFFFMLFSFLNYQFVPFSLAFALLLILFMLEGKKKPLTRSLLILVLVLFTSISITHAFVPLFFVLFLLIRFVINRNKQDGKLFLLTLLIFFIIQFTLAPAGFSSNVTRVISRNPSVYDPLSRVIEVRSVATLIDAAAQMFNAALIITIGIICMIGFAIIFIKRKMTNLDKVIFLTGAAYSGIGIILYALGSRAIPIALIPVSLGAAFLFESRFTRILKPLFLLLLILFPFVSIHLTFFDKTINFQTEESYQAENFVIDYYNWTNPHFILAHFRVVNYLTTRQASLAIFQSEISPLFPKVKYDSIVYTVGLGKNLLRVNSTSEILLREDNFNIVYSNGPSFIAIRSSEFK